MIEALKIWNEPNNLSHWDFQMDPEWKQFAEMVRMAARSIKDLSPETTVVLGGLAPIDPTFLLRLETYDLLREFDAIGIHGFPLDWNHWKLEEWPQKISEIAAVTKLPIWVTEVGASSFGSEDVQTLGLKKTTSLLRDQVNRIYWYSLFDLPPTWEATTRHKESEGSSYYRHYYMGLIRADGSPKPALEHFDNRLGICQWFHFEDHRLSSAVEWLRRMKVRRLRTGISWADWYRPGARKWFDHQVKALEEFDTTVTLCFTPPSRGQRSCHTSPPIDLEEFSQFVREVVERYVRRPSLARIS
jgi:beta-xylosidase